MSREKVFWVEFRFQAVRQPFVSSSRGFHYAISTMPQLRDAPLNTPRLKRSLLALIPVTAALLLVAVVGQLKMNQAINEEMLSVVANGRKETLQQYFQGYASPTAANSYATSPYADNDLAAADGNGIDYSQFDNYGPSPASRSVAPRQTQGAGLNGFLSDDAGDEIIGIPRGSSTAYNIGPNNFPFASTAALQAAQSNIIAQQEALTKYTYAVQSAIATNNAIVTSIQSKLASLVVGKSSTIAVMQSMIDRLKAQNSVLQTKIDKVVASGWPINGKDGKPGRNGRDGTRGPPGIPGKPGAIGPHGPQGLPGLRGIPGLPGAKGAAGRNGHDGHDGHDGKNGKNGANGQVGPRGPSGKDGKNGRDGENGQPGHPGTPGAPGAAGSSSSSHAALTQCKADFFLSRSRGCLRFRLPKSGSLKSGE